MLHAIQAPERVTTPAPRLRPAPVVPAPTPATESDVAATPGTTPATPTTTVALPSEDTGPTFREFFFTHPGIRCTSKICPSVCELTISDWWDYRILRIPSYRLSAFGRTFLPIRPVWLLGTADL